MVARFRIWFLPRLSTEMCSSRRSCLFAAWSKSSTSPFVVSQLLFFFSAFLHPKQKKEDPRATTFSWFIFGKVWQSRLNVSRWNCFNFPTDENVCLCHVSACLQLSLRRERTAVALLQHWLSLCRVEHGAVELLEFCKDFVCLGGVDIPPFPTILALNRVARGCWSWFQLP